MLSRKARAEDNAGYACGQVDTKLARLTPPVTGNVGPGEYGEQRRPSWLPKERREKGLAHSYSASLAKPSNWISHTCLPWGGRGVQGGRSE